MWHEDTPECCADEMPAEAAANVVAVSMGSSESDSWQAASALVTVVAFRDRLALDAHSHDKPTLAVVLNGGFELVFPHRRTTARFVCGGGTIVTQPAGEPHVNYFGSDGARGVVVQPNAAASMPGRCGRFLDDINHFRHVGISATARRLASEISAPDDVTPLAVEGLVLEILASAGRMTRKSAHHAAPPPWLSTVVDFLHAHFRRTVEMTELAAVAGVHPSHLAGVFRRFKGSSPGAYVRRLRLEWAAERLACSVEPVALIASEAGFADQAHLTRWFRRETGWSPAAYRTRCRR